MKMMMMECAALIGGATILGYMYMKKNPEKVQKMKNDIKEMSKMVYEKLEAED